MNVFINEPEQTMSPEALIALGVTGAYIILAAVACEIIARRRGLDEPRINPEGVLAALTLVPMAIFGLVSLLLNPVPLGLSTLLTVDFGLDSAMQDRNLVGRVFLIVSLLSSPFAAYCYLQKRQEIADDVILDHWRDERLARVDILNGRRHR